MEEHSITCVIGLHLINDLLGDDRRNGKSADDDAAAAPVKDIPHARHE